MPTLQQFRYLVAVADCLHFRRAAESVHVTQPTLSAQLRELEEKLGVQLVERSRAGVTLTPIGREVADRARGVLRDVADIAALARAGANPFDGTIRVGIVGSLGGYFLPLILPTLHDTYPRLKFYVREGLAADLMGRLRDGSLDLLFFPLPVEEPGLIHVPLFHEPLLVVMPSDHPLAACDPVPPDGLRGETVMTLETGHRLHDTVAELALATGATLSLDYEGTSLDTLRQMVATGLGLSVLPALYVRSEVTRADLVTARPLPEPQPGRDIALVWRKTAAQGGAFERLARDIREILRAAAPEVTVIDG
ncbi:LysR substrate-binding domain-containing protein [Jannaschia seohaensis]|uniref:LysR family hydrogen peroxide-inducible transcriptional activator n=1 Tax=Jannaschia seohaensis TaxID=475081 RepID=A0A2Y9B6Q9_9RHOB|nr:LysR substrate-binding domain-containing protein [Jannaschia seohaensis]PWJ12075.1 LysR family hydrogen peroxide-inducible transcriptional activator [Jannaschia seohaensis]SSA51178.1 LysR family transcriptional regulator, hydrogen peroxide-inducible genes activator [Jannaschia seohaensis]